MFRNMYLFRKSGENRQDHGVVGGVVVALVLVVDFYLLASFRRKFSPPENRSQSSMCNPVTACNLIIKTRFSTARKSMREKGNGSKKKSVYCCRAVNVSVCVWLCSVQCINLVISIFETGQMN